MGERVQEDGAMASAAARTRLGDKLQTLAAERRKALVVYITVNDPDFNGSLEAALAAIDAGADVLELGVPFSDPVADGPVIQRAMLRALEHGGGFEAALRLARAIRAERDTPLVLFGYLNPLLWHGIEESCRLAHDAGIDAMLVVDAPHDDAHEVVDAVRGAGLDWVSLVAPTSGVERTRSIAASATGFVYLVSMTGVTGSQLATLDPLVPIVAAVREASATPVCIGFGIRDRETARRAAAMADGVVAGTVVVGAIESGRAKGDIGAEVRAVVAELRRGADEA